VTAQVKELIAINGDKKLPPKSLKNIICNVETKMGLLPGTIKPATVCSRIRRNNVEGMHMRHVPVLSVLQPLVVQWCLKMAEIGMSLDMKNSIELVNDLTRNTEFEKNTLLTKYKTNCLMLKELLLLVLVGTEYS
jgi:hypothetical protein